MVRDSLKRLKRGTGETGLRTEGKKVGGWEGKKRIERMKRRIGETAEKIEDQKFRRAEEQMV